MPIFFFILPILEARAEVMTIFSCSVLEKIEPKSDLLFWWASYSTLTKKLIFAFLRWKLKKSCLLSFTFTLMSQKRFIVLARSTERRKSTVGKEGKLIVFHIRFWSNLPSFVFSQWTLNTWYCHFKDHFFSQNFNLVLIFGPFSF